MSTAKAAGISKEGKDKELAEAIDSRNQTPLHLASAEGHIDIVKRLVSANVDTCTYQDIRGRNPLHVAVMKGHLGVVKELVKSANVADMCTSRDLGGRNPVHAAAMSGKVDLMKELLEACLLAAQGRVDQDQTILHLCVEHNQLEALELLLNYPKLQELVNAKDAHGNTALHLAVAQATNVETPLDATTSEGHIKVIKTLVDVSVNMCVSRDLDGRNPLHVAVMKGHLGVVKELINSANVADMCTSRDLGGRNPLHAAAMNGMVDILVELLTACSLAAQERGERDQTILHMSVKHNQLQALELLLSKPELQELVNAKDADGNTALHLAVAQAINIETPLDTSIYEGQINVIKTLVGVSVNMCASRDLDGRNPLHVAVMKGHLGVVKELVNSANAADMCMSRDLGGRNPLHAAAMNGMVEILVELLTACSLAAQERGERDQTILHLTVKHNQLRALELLLGKPELQELVNAKDADGNTALHLAVAQAINIGTPLDTSIYEEHIKVINMLVGVSVNMCASRDLDGRNPLHVAVMKGRLDIVKELVISGNVADMCTARDLGGRNPLHVAAIHGKVDIMKELINACPLAAQGRADRDQTILHLCVEHNQLEALELLLRSPRVQQLVSYKDAYGNTVLHLAAAQATNAEIVEVLCWENIDMNVRNMNGQTALHMLPESERGWGYMGSSNPRRDSTWAFACFLSGRMYPIWGISNTNLPPLVREEEERKKRIIRLMREGGALRAEEIRSEDWVTRKKDSLMVVAALIATGAFQVGMNPPDSLKGNNFFVLSNAIAFAGSLLAILLIASDYTRKSWCLLAAQVTILSVSATFMSFTYARAVITTNTMSRESKINYWTGQLLFGYSDFILLIAIAGAFISIIHLGQGQRSRRRSMVRRMWPLETVSIFNSANGSPEANGTTVGSTQVENP